MSADAALSERTRITPASAVRSLLLFLPPLFAGLWAGAMTITGGSFDPWEPEMMDLEV